MDAELLLHELIQRLSLHSDRRQRNVRLVAALLRFSDAEVVHALEDLYEGALRKREGYGLLLDAFGDFTAFLREFARRLADMYEYAERNSLSFAAELLLPAPKPLPEHSAPRVHHDLSRLTLGERRSLARSAKPTLMEKLLVDPDPAVIANLLDHPRISEREVVRIAAKRPNSAEVLECIAAHQHCFACAQVRLALANNPHTPPRLLLAILPSLSAPERADLRLDGRLSPGFLQHLKDLDATS